MKYDVQFTTPIANEALLDFIEKNVGRAPDAYVSDDRGRVATWRCETQAEAEQIEARVKGVTQFTVGVQPAPEVDGGAIPPLGSQSSAS